MMFIVPKCAWQYQVSNLMNGVDVVAYPENKLSFNFGCMSFITSMFYFLPHIPFLYPQSSSKRVGA